MRGYTVDMLQKQMVELYFLVNGPMNDAGIMRAIAAYSSM